MAKDPRKSETLTRQDAESYLKRFPARGIAPVAFNVALVLASNAVVFWLLMTGLLRAAHLIALVMAETILLIAIAWIQHRLVPRRDWLEEPKPFKERLPVFIFMLVWLSGAYGVTLLMVGGFTDFLELLRSRDAWIQARLHWPLGITAALALMHAVGDHLHYRHAGGPFHSTVSHDAMARLLTLLLGGIPFAMPFFAVTLGGFKGVEYVFKKAKISPEKSVFAGLAMIAVAYASFGVISLLISSQVTGWAIGYVFAKLISEVMVACIPLVMAHVAKNGP